MYIYVVYVETFYRDSFPLNVYNGGESNISESIRRMTSVETIV